MLIERDYMKAPTRSNIKITLLPAPPRTARQWANLLILTLTIVLTAIVAYRIL